MITFNQFENSDILITFLSIILIVSISYNIITISYNIENIDINHLDQFECLEHFDHPVSMFCILMLFTLFDNFNQFKKTIITFTILIITLISITLISLNSYIINKKYQHFIVINFNHFNH